MPPLAADELRNRYFVLRHGLSVANERGLIVSDPAIGCVQYGLSSAGKSALLSKRADIQRQFKPLTHIFFSDFLRTRETAELVAHGLNCPSEASPLLRERYFGEWEGTDNGNYARVWEADRQDPAHTRWKVESVQAVAVRTRSLVDECEQRFTDAKLLFVSHGDPLQILECLFRGQPIALQRSLPSLEPSELRCLRA